jgi:hypothetical protein
MVSNFSSQNFFDIAYLQGGRREIGFGFVLWSNGKEQTHPSI